MIKGPAVFDLYIVLGYYIPMNTLNTLNKNNLFNISIKSLSLCAIIIMLICGIVVYKADYKSMLIFMVYVIFYVQLPGLLILHVLKYRCNHLSCQLALGFFIGWALVVLEYFVSDFIHTNIILYGLGPACSLVFIALCIRCHRKDKTNKNFHFSFGRLSKAYCAFVVLVLLYALLETQYIYMNPEVSSNIYMNADLSYHMGLINSLSHDYPLVSLWVQGREIKYHIFTELLYSVPVRLFGLEADTILMSCTPYLTTYLVSLSFYGLYKSFINKSKYAGICCLLTVLANMYITKSLFSSWYFYHVFSNINNFGFGICACMISVVVAKQYVSSRKENKPAWSSIVILLILIMLITGIKGPIALVLICGMWGTFILGIILRKIRVNAILPILAITVGFLLIYITILGLKGQSNGDGTSFIAFGTVADIAFFKGSLVASLKSIGFPQIIRYGIVFVVFMIFLFTAFVLPFTVGYIRELFLVISGKKDFDFVKVFIYAICLVGLVAMFLLNYSGHSQVYFGFVTLAFVPLISFWLFEDIENNKSLPAKLLRIVFVLCLALTTFVLLTYYKDHIDKAVLYSDARTDHDYYMSMSDDEYHAMKWIENNTPSDCLLATDRYYSVSPEAYSYKDRWANRFFLYANYSNRFCYIAGSGYNLPGGDWVIRRHMIKTNNKLYDVKNDNRGKLANSLGIDYLIVSKRFTDIPDLTNDAYRLCYSNEDIDIYQID